VFQGFNLIPTLTALENVETALPPLPVSAADRRRRSMEALASVGLTERSAICRPNSLAASNSG
jgi:putative ABC transport system ATP-binding protein